MRLHDMPRMWARRCLGIPRFCRAALGVDIDGATLVLAYSTGLDSTALLYLFHALAQRLGLTIVPVHVHHGLRPESDHEAIHAGRVCASLHLPCIQARCNVPALAKASGRGLEETARAERYAALERVRQEHAADWIVTAHHSDDLIEDIMLRLVRGTGWPGLGGMVGVDEKRHILRPLLNWEKKDLHAFALECGLSWCEDASNLSQTYTRNRIRTQILPLVHAENPALGTALRHVWQHARIDENYWQQFPAPIQNTERGLLLPAAELAKAHPAQRLRWYKEIIDKMNQGQALFVQLMALETAWKDQKHGRCIQFPGDKAATVTDQGIFFQRWQRTHPASRSDATRQ
ncbi:tRNA lysidine(34) synthetase TilS [Desulfovibrionales bacterium]